MTVRVHWTDQPYRWHVNDGTEVFSCSRARSACPGAPVAEQVRRLEAGDACFAEPGDEHLARPVGEARIDERNSRSYRRRPLNASAEGPPS